MKLIYSFKIILAVFVLSGILSTSCKKKEDNPPPPSGPVFQGTSWWECASIEVIPDTVIHFYMFSITQEGSLLSGTATVRDSAEIIEGTLSGQVTADSVFFVVDFGSDDLDFSFRGVVDNPASPAEMNGSLRTSPSSANGSDQVLLFIGLMQDGPTSGLLPNNPYIFRKVNSSNHPGDSAVIFIHGMTGDLTHWNDVVAQLPQSFKDKHDVYLYQYNWKDSIMINGKILLDSVVAAGLTHPIIVAHSMGGLVARAYVTKGGEIARLVALGTPNLGTPLARLANLFVFSGFPGPRDMTPEGSFIQTLTNHPSDIASRSKYVVFSGEMKGGFKWVSGRLKWVWAENYYSLTDKIGYNAFALYGKPSNDGLVPVTSAQFQGYPVMDREPVLEWVDHRNLRTPEISTQIMTYINNL